MIFEASFTGKLRPLLNNLLNFLITLEKYVDLLYIKFIVSSYDEKVACKKILEKKGNP
jgi:hypothetical protein